MSANVTIHRGEIEQLKRFVEQARGKEVRGQLFGLWTHSFQPVIQFVTGPLAKGGESQVAQYLRDNHALVHLGNWSTREKDGEFPADRSQYEVRLSIKQKEKNLEIKSTFYDKETKMTERGRHDKLPGQSAFRLCEPLTKEMGRVFRCDVSLLPLDKEDEQSDDSDSTTDQVQVKEEQWYSTEEGMKLFGLIFGTLKENQFEIVETSRDIVSHDIRLVLRYRRATEMRLEFPADFPKSQVNIVRAGNIEAISVQNDSPHKELAEELCQKLKGLATGGGGHKNRGGGGGSGRGGGGEEGGGRGGSRKEWAKSSCV